LIATNFDAELWLRICSIHNPPPVIPYWDFKALAPLAYAGGVSTGAPPRQDLVSEIVPPVVLRRCAFQSGGCLSDASTPTFQVGDELGNVAPELTDDNLHPWCVLIPTGSVPKELKSALENNCLGGVDCKNHACAGPYPDNNCVYLPTCPVHQDPVGQWSAEAAAWDDVNGTTALNWSQRGAINAGLAVFLYLQSLTAVAGDPPPTFDQCPNLLSTK
jgi:hypothetical protein